jgi:hypothetical protein
LRPGATAVKVGRANSPVGYLQIELMQHRFLLVCLSVLAFGINLTASAAVPDDTRWSRTLERIATSVVTIQIDQARA